MYFILFLYYFRHFRQRTGEHDIELPLDEDMYHGPELHKNETADTIETYHNAGISVPVQTNNNHAFPQGNNTENLDDQESQSDDDEEYDQMYLCGQIGQTPKNEELYSKHNKMTKTKAK